MIKQLHFLSGIIFTLIIPFTGINAQIVIRQADMPGIMSKAILAVDTSTSFSPQPASSVAQNWNYSTLINLWTNDYLYDNPSSTPYYSAFHSANVADSLIYAPGYTYYSSTPSAYSEIGFETSLYGFAAGVNLHPFFEQISLPATYTTIDGGFSRGDTMMAISYAGFDSGRAVVNIHYADTVDAFGAMTTPFGTDSVIRQKHYDYTIDSIFVHSTISKTWVFYQARMTMNKQYRWYAKGIQAYFVMMQMSNLTGKDSVIEWFDGVDVGINEISHSSFTKVYPNPCKTEITFNCSAANAKNIVIFDLTGRIITSGEILNGLVSLNTSTYSQGIYFYQVTGALGTILDRGKFLVQ